MKNIIVLLSTILLLCSSVCAQDTVLTAGISMVPKSFYGTWRVISKRVDTNSPSIFKQDGLDVWNLSRTYDVISLCNPFNGAKAEITVREADTSHVVFTKTGKYDKKVLSDRVELNIDGETFVGTDTIKLDTYSGGKIIKTETAKYSLKGEKISGGVTIE